MTSSSSGLQSITIPSHEHFTHTLAIEILQQHKTTAPDLNHIQVILPNAQAVKQFRQSLSQQSTGAIICGYTGSLQQWISENISAANNIHQLASQSARQLLLIEALKQYPSLFAEENHWQVCDSLLGLFDELSLCPHQWLDESLPDWIKHLQQAYQTRESIEHLNQEARIIQTLWHAWQEQLKAMQIGDDATLLRARLLEPIYPQLEGMTFYLVGYEQLSPLEQAWCEQLSQHARVIHVQQGNLPGEIDSTTTASAESEQQAILQSIYSSTPCLIERCQQATMTYSDFPLRHIKLFDAQSAEQEAQAIDLKIRQSLLSGNRNIAIVTENRKLARRLRALLERADINIQDTAGWALATTSAATLMERWLECIEQDFSHLPLLDLLKSPFYCDNDAREQHLQLIYRLEQDIILHENIPNDLQRYRNAIKHRSERLNLHIESCARQLSDLLNTLDQASQELRALHKKQISSPQNWINCFIESLERLGVRPQLQQDIAGQRVWQELQVLQQACNIASPDISWQDFRTWLGDCLEREQFKPHEQTSVVKIMNLQQAQYCQFDTLIVAGATAQSFPGKAKQLPFFNQSVRKALQLQHWQQQKDYQHYQFQQMLLAADDILLTWQSEEKGEWIAASPWVSSLKDFSELAFKHSMLDEQLAYLVQNLPTLTQRSQQQLDRILPTQMATPSLVPELVPSEFSASRQQRLIDCPYKFFAADALKLKPLEAISTELMKSEYGEKVHLILQAFHQPLNGLPEPFTETITRENRSQALSQLEKISRHVFSRHSEDSIKQRGWLERWLNTAASYIDWQISHNQQWSISQLEQQASAQLSPEIQLTGRLDRIDKAHDNLCIIDYKTGATASKTEIQTAENVQLISYASLINHVSRVLYLKLDNGKTQQTAELEDQELEQLKHDTLDRLQTIIEQIRSSAQLPSWGDSNSCNFCDMQGLCRKQIWQANQSS